MKAWKGFKEGAWTNEINVRDFINLNYEEYLGDSSFLAGPTEASIKLNERFFELLKEEKEKGGVIELDTKVVAGIASHDAGYIIKDLEKIVGLQTDKPFKRAFHPYGGIQVATQAFLKTALFSLEPPVRAGRGEVEQHTAFLVSD